MSNVPNIWHLAHLRELMIVLLEATDPAKTTPLATETGAWAVSLLGFAVDHKISPEFASKATHAPAVVVRFDGFNVKFCRLLLAMFVYTLLPSVAAPHCPPPSSPPGPANLEIRQF